MENIIVKKLLALKSSIDPKVALVVQKPQAGSNVWTQVVFNDYCYQKMAGNGTEDRTRAMADVLGQAAVILAKEDPEGNISLRTFYRNQKGEYVPRLHMTIRPDAEVGAGRQMDVPAELAKVTQMLAAKNYDFSRVPVPVATSPGAYLGFLKAELARDVAATLVEEMQDPDTTHDDAPDL